MWGSAVQVCSGLLSGKSPGGLAQLARAPALHAGGQRFESVILHHSFEICWFMIRWFKIIHHTSKNQKWIVLWHIDTKQNSKETSFHCLQECRPVNEIAIYSWKYELLMPASLKATLHHISKKVRKGAWRMPWLTEAMKDVISCDKLRVGANNLWSGDFRMGQPSRSSRLSCKCRRRTQGTETS